MINEIKDQLELYRADWVNWLNSVGLDQKGLAPTAAGWKVSNAGEFLSHTELLIPLSSQAHIADVNDRKIGSFVLKEYLPMDLQVIKLMQRRTGSNDKLGLDHIDFTVNDLDTIEIFLKKMNVPYEWQSNDMHRWISARIVQNREAKFVDHTVLDVGSEEMSIASRLLLKKPN